MSEIYLPAAVRRRAGLGNDKLVYFERISDGHLIIPPIANAPSPVCRIPFKHDVGYNRECMCGYVRREANSVKELEAVSKRKEAQRKADFARIDAPHQARIAAKMAEVRKRLNARLLTNISNFERDFIRAALKHLEAGEVNWGPRRVEGHLAIEATEAKLG